MGDYLLRMRKVMTISANVALTMVRCVKFDEISFSCTKVMAQGNFVQNDGDKYADNDN